MLRGQSCHTTLVKVETILMICCGAVDTNLTSLPNILVKDIVLCSTWLFVKSEI